MGWWNFLRSKKIKVNTEQMGEVLYCTAISRTKAFLEDDSVLEGVGLENEDRNYLFQELVIVNMFVLITVFERSEVSDRQRNEILDKMHALLFGDPFEVSNKEVKAFLAYASQRYSEYNDATQSNREANWLRLLAKRVTNNLRREVVCDEIAVMNMAIELTSSFKFTPGLLKEYEIIG